MKHNQNKQIKLLILLKSIDGGTGTYLKGLLGLKKKYSPGDLNIEVLILEKPKYRKTNNQKYIYFPRSNPITIKYKLTRRTLHTLLSEIKWFIDNIKTFKPDIVIASDSHSILIGEIVRFINKFKYRTVNVIHNNLREVVKYRLRLPLRLPFKWLLGFYLRKSDVVVTVSGNLSKDVYIDYKLKEMPKTIPPPFSDKFSNTASRNKSKRKEKVIISVARLDKQKDHETLLKAFADVRQKSKNLRLWIVGDGPLRMKLQLLSKKMGIERDVRFLGWKQNSGAILNQADVFVHSSNWEGFGLGILEAMQKGIPVIASDCDYGPSEIIGKNKYGILVPVGDYKSMSKAIYDICFDEKKFKHFSQMAQKRSQDFKSDKILSKYKNLIDNLS